MLWQFNFADVESNQKYKKKENIFGLVRFFYFPIFSFHQPRRYTLIYFRSVITYIWHMITDFHLYTKFNSFLFNNNNNNFNRFDQFSHTIVFFSNSTSTFWRLIMIILCIDFVINFQPHHQIDSTTKNPIFCHVQCIFFSLVVSFA